MEEASLLQSQRAEGLLHQAGIALLQEHNGAGGARRPHAHPPLESSALRAGGNARASYMSIVLSFRKSLCSGFSTSTTPHG